MADASERLEFEQAAALRDRLKALAHITVAPGHQRQRGRRRRRGRARSGRRAGLRAGVLLPRRPQLRQPGLLPEPRARTPAPDELLDAFLGQFYAERSAAAAGAAEPHPGLAGAARRGAGACAPAARSSCCGRSAARSASWSCRRRPTPARRWPAGSPRAAPRPSCCGQLADRLDLPETPGRIEVYDNSHIMGTDALGAFIVAGPEGLNKSGYRTVHHQEQGSHAGRRLRDDARGAAAPLRPAATRGSGAPEPPVAGSGDHRRRRRPASARARDPGGPAASSGCRCWRSPRVPSATPGARRCICPGGAPFKLDPRDPVLYFLAAAAGRGAPLRDHQPPGKRGKRVGRSALDRVPGVGAKRKRALLGHFGSVRAIETAGLLDLERVPGISKAVAKAVYDAFHEAR